MAFAVQQRARFGDAFTVRIEPRPWVMLADPDAVRDLFTAGPDVAHAGEANEILRPILGSHSILLLDEGEHLRQRRLMLPPFHGERMLRYRDVMREATERAVATWPVGEAFALRPHTQAITLEVILRAVFGVEAGAAAERLRAPLERLLRWFGDPRFMGVVGVLGPGHPLVARLNRRIVAPVDAALYGLIAERRARRRPRRARGHPLDAPARPRRTDGRADDRRRAARRADDAAAGRPRDDGDRARVGGRAARARVPGALDRVARDGAYRDAVVKETLRLRPVLPIVLRRLARDARVGGRD